MDAVWHPAAESDLQKIKDSRERAAIQHAVEKLESAGDRLPFPHSSAVKGAQSLRELRPRGGRSAWRAFYRRVGSVMVIASVGPEAEADSRGFNKAVKAAEDRLDEVELE